MGGPGSWGSRAPFFVGCSPAVDRAPADRHARAMTVLILPKRVALTATRQQQVTATRRPAIVQGSSYIDYGTILDENGDPFDLGPTNSPNWTFAAQVRYDVADRAATPLATFTVAVINGPLGQVSYSMAPAQSILLATDRELVWDFDATNVSDTNFAAGWVATIWYGPAASFRDVTRT